MVCSQIVNALALFVKAGNVEWEELGPEQNLVEMLIFLLIGHLGQII